MTDLTTRYIGTCVVCERKIRVRDNHLVHHGYKRPGDGYIYGDCFGVGYEPHETSDDLAKKYLKWCEDILPNKEASLVSNKEKLVLLEKELQELCSPAIAFNKYHEDFVKYENEIYKLRKSINLLNHEITTIKNIHIKRIKERIVSWSPMPLLTFEEEIQNKKAEAAQVRADKKRAKLEAAVKRFQERIDSAYKRNNKEALANLYESICRKLYNIDKTLNKQERLRLVDRESVWKDLGVFKAGCYYEDYGIARDIITRES